MDLLGRHQVETDIDSIAGYLTGKKVLVTGAGGSIGSELCRQIHYYEPAELMMLDRDESSLHAVQLSSTGRALLDDDSMILADIRQADVIKQLFAERPTSPPTPPPSSTSPCSSATPRGGEDERAGHAQRARGGP